MQEVLFYAMKFLFLLQILVSKNYFAKLFIHCQRFF